MNVLVTAATKHGATREIAEAIADELRRQGLAATSVALSAARVEDADAVVLGSAVYAGRWLRPATEFVRTHSDDLRARPVWLFSSGPVGDPPKPDEDPVDAAAVVEATAARGHAVFAGRLDRGGLTFAEKAIVVALRAPQGDFRDWEAIRRWARAVAAQLGGPTARTDPTETT